MHKTSDLRISDRQEVISASSLLSGQPISKESSETVYQARENFSKILNKEDHRLSVVVGPCSIHDTSAAIDYAGRLKEESLNYKDQLQIIMRVYFEKPRTTVGWKGLINDPELNETFDISQGLQRARRLLQEINDMGMPAACEFLDPVVPHYFEDLVSWVAIGARTTESQTHRQMASAIGIPVGFKNGTDGSFDTAADGIMAARGQHSYVGTGPDGHVCVLRTDGNPDGHLVLRGGKSGPNYDSESIGLAREVLAKGDLDQRLVVDCSHGNSNKDHERQPLVFEDVVSQRAGGDKSIVGVMLESNINPGSQKLAGDPTALEYGVSITDACVGWAKTEEIILWADDALNS